MQMSAIYEISFEEIPIPRFIKFLEEVLRVLDIYNTINTCRCIFSQGDCTCFLFIHNSECFANLWGNGVRVLLLP